MTDTDTVLSLSAGIGRIDQASGLFPRLPKGLASALDESLSGGEPIWFAIGRDGAAAWIETGPAPERLASSRRAGRLVHEAALPEPGIVQISQEERSFDIGGSTDLLLDVHGPRFPGLGVAEGFAAVRVEAGSAQFRSRVSLRVWKMVERDASALRIRFFPDGERAVLFPARTTCTLEEDGRRLAVLAGALAGRHPCDRLYALLQLTGSRRWAAWAAEIGASAAELAEFRARWLEMPRPAALAVWRAAGEQDALDALFEWTTRLNHDFDAPEELEAMLGAWSEAEPEFRGSVVTEWIEAAAQESLDGRLTAAAFARLREASRHLHSMLNDESRMALLRRVRRWAAVSRETGGAPEAGFEATARSVLDLAPAAAVEVWENRVAGLLQASDGSRPLADATLCGAGAESAFRRIEGGDMDPLAGDGPSGFLPGLGVLTHLMPRRLAVEIHLPFAGRCDPLRRLETIRRATARPAPGGQIVLLAGEAGREAAERERYQNVLALAGSWRCAKSGVTPATYHLSAGTSGIVTDAASAGCWSRLLEFYGLPAPPYGAQSPARRHALSLSLPGELAAAWTTVPPERDAAFFPLFQAVSLAVQSALRFWLPALWLRDARRFGVKERALPLLIYTATEPFTPETRACLTYDLFDRDAVERAVRSGRRRLPALFNQVRASLEAAGQPKIAKLYDPDGCADIRTALRQRPRIFRSLLAAETFFVNQLTQLAVAGHHVRTLSLANPIRALKLTDEFSEHFAAVVQRKLFNLLGEEADFAPLGGVILLEATAALAGRRERLQATARIERGEETFLQVAQPRAR